MRTDLDHPAELLEQAVQAHRAGRADQAEPLYRRVLASSARNTDALNLLGVLLCDAGNTDEGVALIRRAVDLAPTISAYRLNLAIGLREAGRLDQAFESLQHALRLQPDYADAHYELGQLWRRQDRHAQAEEAFRKVLALVPAHREAWKGLAQTLELRGRMQEAALQYRAYLAAYPDDDGMRYRFATLLPPIPESQPAIVQWRTRLRGELEALLARRMRIADPLNDIGRTLFFLSYHGLDDRGLLELAARVALHACPALRWEAPFCGRWRGPGPRIRIGFISQFFKDHSIGKTSAGLVERLSRERFAVIALFVPPLAQDPVAAFIRQRADQSVVLPRSIEGAREAIAALELDVLFYQDIGMEPFTYFLAFSRLAPVQCVSFGHPDTTGVAQMDYFVSSDLYELPGAQASYSERLATLRGLPTLAYYRSCRNRGSDARHSGCQPAGVSTCARRHCSSCIRSSTISCLLSWSAIPRGCWC